MIKANKSNREPVLGVEIMQGVDDLATFGGSWARDYHLENSAVNSQRDSGCYSYTFNGYPFLYKPKIKGEEQK